VSYADGFSPAFDAIANAAPRVGWNRSTVAPAICATLTTATEGSITCFPDPPPSFNPPAYIVAWPTTVTYHAPLMGVDEATLPLLCAVAENQSARLDDLLNVARWALVNDPTLGGLLANGLVVVAAQRNWRILADVAGARFLCAELTLEIRQ
jgi:hypothetical protein